MKRETKITSAGIKKVLKNYNHNNSIAEFIWNGFDAKATTVKLDYEADAIGRIQSISISDNGYGINTAKLDEKFDKFYDSEKSIEIQSPKHSSTLHGKNGIGRLTFFTFANNAEWKTCYKNGKFRGGIIRIDSDNLKSSTAVETEPPFQETETTVTFNNITIFEQNIQKEVIPFLKEEFCWFLELHKSKGYRIIINNTLLDYSDLILDSENFVIKEQSAVFEIKYIQWSKILNKENSKFYYLNSKNSEVYKDFTTLNRKGDQFYHSLYIQSNFFNNFDFRNQNEAQTLLFAKAKSAPEYKTLNKELDIFLQKKRKPYLRHYAETLIDDYERLGVFPEFKNSWESARKTELKETIMGLYEVQPKIFIDLNLEQKKTFVRFLNLLLESNEREHIFDILEEVTNLDSAERKDLANLFKTTKLNRIVATLKLIEDRYRTYHDLYDIVFKPELNAAEVPHLQTLIENHYWIFGEEYHLVTAAEPKFNEALRRYIFHLNGEKPEVNIDHEHKNKEMDIFSCR
ncbi:ATP-binding protein [Hymenobacter monticola]|uniref:ATP-binding protein n=1 Tax=Hymenobacter monticola TaxID=1705399 RepID=A0ABY4B8P1_9BACT|nr:ATP-binding protein [Hymenobacter monticola]UOE34361.1 ATP-binding protein [Hymenobacter monticola]